MFVFFFKQKTAYEVRISDWSSDVCSSDLRLEIFLVQTGARRLAGDAKDRDRVGGGGVKAGDHVRTGGTGCADADADVAVLGAGIALGHMRSALERKSGGEGKSGSVRVDLGGRRTIKKKTTKRNTRK